MACSKPIRNPDEQELLECAICLELMTEPYTLTSCLHSYCKECVDELREKQQNEEPGVTCPLCRKHSPEIKFNFFLNELLVRERKKKDPGASLICLNCNVLKPVDTLWKCLECRVNLCQVCREGHLRFPFSRSHQTMRLVEGADDTVDNIVFCSKHTDKPIEFFCNRCNTVICITCQVVDHRNHEVETTQHALENMVPKVETRVSNLEARMGEVKKNMETIKKEVTEVEKARDRAMKDVDQEEERVMGVIKKIKKNLKDDIENMAGEQIQFLISINERFLNLEKELVNLKYVTKACLERAQHTTQLTELVDGRLTERLEKVNEEIVQEVLDIKKPEWRGNEGGWGDFVQGEGILGEVIYYTKKVSLASGGQRVDKLGRRYWGGSFVEVFKKPLKQTSEIKLRGWGKKVTVVQENIWVPLFNNNVIDIYTKEGKLQKSITTEGRPTCVEKTHKGELVVSFDTGMFVLDKEGKNPLVKVSEGSYSDVCVFGNRVFSLDNNARQIVEFVRDEVRGLTWLRQERVVAVGWLNNTDLGDTLLVRECQDNPSYPTDLEFFICVRNQHTIYKVNHQGKKIRSYGSWGEQGEGRLDYPFLCGMDREGRLLVADEGHNEYKLLDTQNKEWSSVFTVYNCVYDVQVEGEHTVWCNRYTGGGFVISKHEVVL